MSKPLGPAVQYLVASNKCHRSGVHPDEIGFAVRPLESVAINYWVGPGFLAAFPLRLQHPEAIRISVDQERVILTVGFLERNPPA
jgi:hypothetical protein